MKYLENKFSSFHNGIISTSPTDINFLLYEATRTGTLWCYTFLHIVLKLKPFL